MTNYKCEDPSLCEKFQAAICLHCNHRLCVQHIIEHDQIVFDDVKKLSNVTEDTFQQIKDKSEKNRIVCDDLLPTFDEWRTQKLEKLEQVYENELLLIKNEEETLENFHRYLLEKFEREARQPLERVQRQQNINTEVLNHIQQTIEKIRKKSTQLKWDFSLNSDPAQIPRVDNIIPTENQQAMNKKSSAVASTNNYVVLRKGRSLIQLVKIFLNISSINQSKIDIHNYIQNHEAHCHLPILINSYLTTWHQTSNVNEKPFLLFQHISTIQRYLVYRRTDFDVLIGIQLFFSNATIHENKYEMMAFLLQFFLYHQCIHFNLLFNWYNNNNSHGYIGFAEAKQLAVPFIITFLAHNTGDAAVIQPI